jgi:hypothetical protein
VYPGSNITSTNPVAEALLKTTAPELAGAIRGKMLLEVPVLLEK